MPAIRARGEGSDGSGARAAIIGAILGTSVDTWDVYLPAIVLPVASTYFEPPGIAPAIRVTLVYVVLLVSVLGRPIGGIIFGSLSDHFGRRRIAVTTLIGFTVATLLVAAMPGYANWGLGAIIVLAILRLIGGVFLGGAHTGLSPLAMERCPKDRRGLASGVIFAGSPASFVVFTSVQLALIAAVGRPAYATWGWRIPFLLGVIYGACVIAYYLRTVPESDSWQRERGQRDASAFGLRALFRGPNVRPLAQTFLVVCGLYFALSVVINVLPSLLITILHQGAETVNVAVLVGNAGILCAGITAGWLSERIGRRRIFMYAGIWIAVLSTAIYALMIESAKLQLGAVITALAIVIVLPLTMAPWGLTIAYINERFATNVRASGYGIAYLVGQVIPALYSFYLLGLGKVMPYEYTELVLMVLGGALLFLGALLGPETRGIDLGAVTSPVEAQAGTPPDAAPVVE